jgi:hypothetical protein
MIVVSDTSPLTALLTIGEAGLLSRLFGEVIIPEEVSHELARSHSSLPSWIKVETVKNSAEAASFAQTVDKGEAEAIELAKELQADRLLIDERKGRQLASARRRSSNWSSWHRDSGQTAAAPNLGRMKPLRQQQDAIEALRIGRGIGHG